MNFFAAIVLGLVEGLTEFLPVSSTGHLILASRLLGLPQTDALKSFEIAIQLGAIAAVVAIYRRRFATDYATMKRIAAAFAPTAVLGLALYKIVKTVLLSNDAVVVWALALGGAAMIAFEKWRRPPATPVREIREMSYLQSAAVGVCQALAMIPGVSRSGATIIGGLALGVERKAIVEFSFLLAVPTMVAATALDVAKSYAAFGTADLLPFASGFLAAFAVAMAAVKFFLKYIERHTFVAFGLYRIAAALAYFLIMRP